MYKIELEDISKFKVKNLEIKNFYDLDYYLERWKKFYLFSKEDFVFSKIVTDGTVEQQRIWVDKFPTFYDIDYRGHLPMYRSEFIIDNPKFVLIEKYLLDSKKLIRDLYLSKEFLDQEKQNLSGVEVTAVNEGKLLVRKRD